MGPIVVLRGTQIAKDYYQILLTELEQNIENKTGVLTGRKYQVILGWNADMGKH